MFQGFPKQTVEYLKALNNNNNREWFEAHRSDYETYYLEPALQLIEALAPAALTLEPPHQAVPKLNKSLRRINRDTRFSKDKTPYHARIHIVLWTGDHPNRSAGIHFVMAHDHFGFGGGHWAFAGDGLDRYRAAVQQPATRKKLEQALNSAAELGCLPGEPELRKVPRGIEAEGMVADLLRRKGLVARTPDGNGFDERLFGPSATDYLVGIMRSLAPLNQWVATNVES